MLAGIDQVGLFIATGLLLNLTPGPDVLYIVSRGLRAGRRAGMVAALGITAASAAGVAPTYLGHRGPRSRLNRWRSGAGR